MRLRASIPLVWAAVSGCYASRPAFVEPGWGNAPSPAVDQIAEVTRNRVQCTLDRCRHTILILSRDGRASREYSTQGRVDSLFIGHIDSLTFATLASGLIRRRFFTGSEQDAFNPLASDATMTTASILCRRMVHVVDASIPTKPGAYPWLEEERQLQAFVDSVAGAVHWDRCCRRDL